MIGARVARRDSVNHGHAFDHPSEDQMTGDTTARAVLRGSVGLEWVKVQGGNERYEELAAIGVYASGVGHRQYSRPIVAEGGAELVGESVARAAPASAGRVSALRHESRDDTMERHAVIEAVAGEEDEVVNGLEGFLCK